MSLKEQSKLCEEWSNGATNWLNSVVQKWVTWSVKAAENILEKPLVSMDIWNEKEQIDWFFSGINLTLSNLPEEKRRQYLLKELWKVFKDLLNLDKYESESYKRCTFIEIFDDISTELYSVIGGNGSVKNMRIIFKNLTWIDDDWFNKLRYEYLLEIMYDSIKKFLFHSWQIINNKWIYIW